MKHLLHLLRWDFQFLVRYQLVTVSILITGLYWLIFKGLEGLGMQDLLVLIVFNDPLLLGMLFGGLLLIMDRNQQTVLALAATPLSLNKYFLSKLISLSLLSLVLCIALYLLIEGNLPNPLFFVPNIFLSASFFTIIGFLIGQRQTQFLNYMLQLVGALLILAVPLLGYYQVTVPYLFIWMPTAMTLELLNPEASLGWSTLCLVILIGWNILAFWFLQKRVRQIGWN